MNVVSEIYSIRSRGAVVNAACQWIMEHRRLAMRIILLPNIVLVAIELFSKFMFAETGIFFAINIICSISFISLPCLMVHVVEHKEEFGYPERLPRPKDFKHIWWRYTWTYLLAIVVYSLAIALSFVTIFGWMIVIPIVPLAIVIFQRDDENVFSAFTLAFKYAFKNFGTFFMTLICIPIIFLSFAGAPWFIIRGTGAILTMFFTKDWYTNISQLFNGDLVNQIALFALFTGISIASDIVYIIFVFLYGHCKESDEHPSIINRMDNFNSPTS